MSVIETVKRALGAGNDHPTYRCLECETEFESGAEPDSVWFKCPECDSEQAERIDE
ncbi:MAG: hypothetical protein ABEH35_03045 [Haloarculaceae archaeon]